jgi:hypothetical protein
MVAEVDQQVVIQNVVGRWLGGYVGGQIALMPANVETERLYQLESGLNNETDSGLRAE